MQKVMRCATNKNDLRDEIFGWTFEDGDQVHKAFHERLFTRDECNHPNDVPVGFIRSGLLDYPCYPTVLHAIGVGWKLLAPPQQEDDDTYTWWLVKD